LNDCIDLLNETYPAIMQQVYTSMDPKFIKKRFIGRQKVFYN
jgi:hypothetical protein